VIADILRRYLAAVSLAGTRELSSPGTHMVHVVDLKFENSLCKDLNILDKLQDTDPRLKDQKDNTLKIPAPHTTERNLD
jgi:hypothetical protein